MRDPPSSGCEQKSEPPALAGAQGPQGPASPMGPKRVIPVHRGQWGRRAHKVPPAYQVRLVQPVRTAAGRLGPPGPPGPAGTTGLHALRQPACNTKCELICSVTCPGGRIHIEEIAESNSASCIGASGRAIALSVRQ